MATPAAAESVRSPLLDYLDAQQKQYSDLKVTIASKVPANPVTPFLGRIISNLKNDILPAALTRIPESVTNLAKQKFWMVPVATTALSVLNSSFMWDSVSGVFTIVTAAVDLDKRYKLMTRDAALLLFGRHALNLLEDAYNLYSGNLIYGGVSMAIDLAFAAKLGLIIIDKHST